MGTPPVGWAASAPRALGWVTVAYSAALLVRPRLLGDACGYTTATGKLPRPAATLIAAIGARDVASGLAMALAPRRTPLRAAIAVRVAADLSDAVIFGIGLQDAQRTRRIAGFAALWAAACAASIRVA